MSPSSHIRRHWAVFLGLAIGLTVWGAVDVARRAIVDPQRPALHMTDFTVYTEAGAAFFDGREPYDVANIRGWKYLYPPLFALLVSPLAHLTPPWQALVWFGLSALMAFGSYFECRRLIAACCEPGNGRNRDEELSGDRLASVPTWLFVTALVAPLFPALNCLQRGQMGLALIYPLLLGFRLVWVERSPVRQALGGLVLALPIALKLTPALPVAACLAALGVAGWAQWRSWKTVSLATGGVVAGCLVFFLLLPASLLGWNANLRHLQTWYVKVASRVDDVRSDDFGGDVASLRNQSLHNAVFRCGNWIAHALFDGPDDQKMNVRQGAMPMDAPIVGRLLTTARLAALAALTLVIVVAGRSRELLLISAAFGLACVATLVVSPVSRGHYFVFWLPSVVFVPLWFLRIGDRQKALVAAVIPAVLTAIHYVLLDYAGRAGLLGLGTTAWYFGSSWMIWRTRAAASGIGVEPIPESVSTVRARAA